MLNDVATDGRGGLVFITGEAGIGKIRLATELRTQALAHGCRWLEGRYDKEGSVPLKPYSEAVRTYLLTESAGRILGHLPEWGLTGTRSLRQRL